MSSSSNIATSSNNKNSYETIFTNSDIERNNSSSSSSSDSTSISIKEHSNNNNNIKTKKGKKHIGRMICLSIILLILFIIIGCFIGCFIYVSIYYHASSNALTYLNEKDNVKVKKINSGYHFDGPGNDKALIFYPGAKIEESAYADIMHGIAKNGIDCFLVKMPFRLAFLGINKANKIIEENKKLYPHWYMAGHSLGGAMAGYYVSKHQDNIDGFAMLGAYTTSPIPEKVKTLSILASNDKILNWNTYKKNIKNLPGNFTEISIEGGNHSQFGDYGHQKGDGTATISMEEQHNQIINAIVEAFK